MRAPKPTKPERLDPLAEELLTGLGPFPAARDIVLGGYFALKHYCDYRQTHDVDAWWSASATTADIQNTRAAIRAVLGNIAGRLKVRLNERRFGDTESWELLEGDSRRFSFQIARRTLHLDEPVPSPWPPLRIETLADNLGSKMNALVQRGAPRDFVDVRQVVLAQLATPAECWALWQRKNPDLRSDDARAELLRHLEELALRRPLERIADSTERQRAADTRDWYRRVFLSSP